jgi:hypothetical protein
MDPHNQRGAFRILKTIGDELSNHHVFSLRRIFTYGADFDSKIRELILYQKLPDPIDHPLF